MSFFWGNNAFLRRRWATFFSIWCIIIFCLCFAPASSNEGGQTYRLDRIERLPQVIDFFFSDVDGDGQDELIRLGQDRRVFFVNTLARESLLGPALYQGNATRDIISMTVDDIDGKPGSELALAYRDETGDSVWLEIFNGTNPGDLLCRTKGIQGKNISKRNNHVIPGWDGGIGKCYFIDLDNDGDKEIVYTLVVGFDLYPRGVYAFDYPSGEPLWHFPLAGSAINLSFVDADGDGRPEIFFKTYACANGAEVDGRSDTSAYVICLDYTGKAVWLHPLGDRFDMATGDVLVCDCDNDNSLDVYFTVLIRTEDYDRQIRVLEKHRAIDNKFIRQKSFDAGSRFSDVVSFDLNGDGLRELILNDYPTILDPEYLTVDVKGSLQPIGTIKQIIDIDPDEKNGAELIVAKQDSLYILNSRLDIIATYQEPLEAQIVKSLFFRSLTGVPCLAILSSVGLTEGSYYNLNVFEVVPTGVKTPWTTDGTIHWAWLIVIFIGGLFVGMFLKCRLSLKERTKSIRFAQLQNLHTALLTFDHGQMAARNLNRLQFLFSNLPESQEKLNDIRQNLRSAVEAFFSFTTKQLNNIVDIGKKIRPLRGAITEISRCNACVLGLLKEVPADEIVAGNNRDVKSKIPDAIDKITRSIRLIKTHIQSDLSVDLLKSIPEVLSAVSGRCKEERVILKKVSGTGLMGRHVFFSQVEFAGILEELITNACAAMTNARVKELELLIEDQNDEVAVTLFDTGCGFSGENPTAAFERDFSTKSRGGGFGLYNIRQQVERFGGRVKLGNNDNGSGAFVTIIFKAVQYE